MKFDPAKSYPHPVLRPQSSDYVDCALQVEISLDRVPGSVELWLTAEFDLSDPDIQRLIDDGNASYALLARCSKTHYRALIQVADCEIRHTIDDGEIAGLAEFAPFVIATRPITGFSADHWHPDFEGMSFDLKAGAVLALDEPKEYWIDNAEEAPIGSIFNLSRTDDDSLEVGQWRCSLDSDRVQLEMRREDHEQFLYARAALDGSSDGAYIMSALYLPALVYVLTQADASADDLRDYRWFRSLESRLDTLGCSPLGSQDSKIDRLQDAQRIFDDPFARLPFMTQTEVVT